MPAAHTTAFATRRRALGALLKRAWYEYQRDYAKYFAVAMVYYALISLVPFLLLLLGVIGLLLRFSDAAATLEQQLLAAVESNFGEPLQLTLQHMLEQVSQQSLVATVVSVVGLLVTAASLFGHLRMTFRAIWKRAPPLASDSLLGALRATFSEKVIAYLIVVLGGTLFFAALVLLAGIQWLTGLLSGVPAIDFAAGAFISIASPIVIVGLTFTLLFLALPPVRLQWRHVWLATVLSTAVWIITAELLVLFGGVFGKSGTPGALGSVLAMMLWFNIVCQVLFYGAELCKVVYTDLTSSIPHSPT
jgi:membrane protein